MNAPLNLPTNLRCLGASMIRRQLPIAKYSADRRDGEFAIRGLTFPFKEVSCPLSAGWFSA